IDGASDFFANDRSHGTTDKGEIHTRQYKVATFHFAVGTADSIVQACFCIAFFETLGVFLRIFESKWIARSQVGEKFGELVVVKKDREVGGRTDTEVIATIV